MLLYLSSNQNIGLFDFLMNEHGILVKKLSGEFYLNKFVIRDMRNFNHYSFIALDLKSLKDSENEMIEAVTGFRTMYDSRIIILADGRNQGDELLSKLYDVGIRNFITAQTMEEIKKEILECVSAEGMSHEMMFQYKYDPTELSEETKKENKSHLLPTDYRFNCKGLKIAVAGVSGKVGTTTTALNLAHFLTKLGAKVSYLEANHNGHIALLSSFYQEITSNENFMEHKDVRYYSTKVKFNFMDFHFNILDVGVLSPEYLEIFKKSDIRILCSTSKPYELTALIEVLKLAGDTEVYCIFSFTSDRSRKDIRGIVKGADRKIYFTNYSPDLFDGNANKAIWSDVISEYIVADMPQTKREKKKAVLF